MIPFFYFLFLCLIDCRLQTTQIRHLDGGVWYEENNLFWVSFRDSLAPQEASKLVRDPLTAVQQIGSRLVRKVETLTESERCVETEAGEVCSPSPGWAVPDIESVPDMDCPNTVKNLLNTLCDPTCESNIDASLRVGMFNSPSWILDDFANQRPLALQDITWRSEDLGYLSGTVSVSNGWKVREGQLYYSTLYAELSEVVLDGVDSQICDIRLSYRVLESFDATQLQVLAYQTSDGLEKQDFGQVSLSEFSVVGETCSSTNECMDTTRCCSGLCGYDTCISSSETTSASNSNSSAADISILIVVCAVGVFMIMTVLWFFLIRRKGRSTAAQNGDKKLDMEKGDAGTKKLISSIAPSSIISEGPIESRTSGPTYNRQSPRQSPHRHSRSSERRRPRSRSGSQERDLDTRRYRRNFHLMDEHRSQVDRISPEDSVSNINGPTLPRKNRSPFRKHKYEPSEHPTISTVYPHDSVSNIHVLKNNHVAGEQKLTKAGIYNQAWGNIPIIAAPPTSQHPVTQIYQNIPMALPQQVQPASIPRHTAPPQLVSPQQPVVVHVHQSSPQILGSPQQPQVIQPIMQQPIMQQVRQPQVVTLEEYPSRVRAHFPISMMQQAPVTAVSHPHNIVQQQPPAYSSLPYRTMQDSFTAAAHVVTQQLPAPYSVSQPQLINYIQQPQTAYTYV